MSMTGGGGSMPPATEGVEYGAINVEGNPKSVFSGERETRQVILLADTGNDAEITVGWDENVAAGNGPSLGAGDSMTIPVDASRQDVYVVSSGGSQVLQFMSLG